MNEMIGYIFGSLRTSETSIKNIRRILREQARTNRMVTVFALSVTAYVFAAGIQNMKQYKEIKKLSRELEELKRMKGD